MKPIMRCHTIKAGSWGVQEALLNRASKNYGPKKKL